MFAIYHRFINASIRDSRRQLIFADECGTMPMLVILGIGGALCGWSLLLIFSGERQRRLLEAMPPATPVKQNKKN